MIKGINIVGYAYSSLAGNVASAKKSTGFESIMSQKTYQQSNSKNVWKNDETRSSDIKDNKYAKETSRAEDSARAEKTEQTSKSEDLKSTGTSEENAAENKAENNSENVSESKSDDNSKDKAENNAAAKKVDDEKLSKLKTDSENEAIEKIAEIIGTDAQSVMNILQNLNMNVEDLADNENLTAFMQKAMNVDNAIDLISIDNVTDMMSQIQEIAQKSAQFSQNLEQAADARSVEIPQQGKRVQRLTEEKSNIENGKGIEENAEKPLEQKIQTAPERGKQDNFNFFGNRNSQQAASEQEIPQNTSAHNISANINKALNNAVIKTESARGTNAAEIINQIVEKIKVSSNSEITEMNIKLKPEELGELTLRIISDSGTITAQFTAESRRVKEIIESNFDMLKDALAQNGIEIDQLEVNVGGNSENYSAFDSYNDFAEGSLYFDDEEGEAPSAAVSVTESEVMKSNVSYVA